MDDVSLTVFLLYSGLLSRVICGTILEVFTLEFFRGLPVTKYLFNLDPGLKPKS